MPINNPKYDVAISFLSRDEVLARSIYEKLGALEVFFFPRNQEQLAGTDGLESMRRPFFDDSRVMVVLYQEPWGQTPWTRVEETAIKESCLQHGWQRLFFIVLNQASNIPVWLPTHHVRFNFADFGLEQAVGAIKARVEENGGKQRPLTALKRAEMVKAEELFRLDKSLMNSFEGIQKILVNVAELFREIEKRCDDIKEQDLIRIDYETNFTKGSSVQSCTLTEGHVGMIVAWNQQFSNLLDHSSLVVTEFNGGLIIGADKGRRMHITPPELLGKTKYSPDLSYSREYGWTENGTSELLSSSALAEKCVIEFADLVNRYRRGEMRRRV